MTDFGLKVGLGCLVLFLCVGILYMQGWVSSTNQQWVTHAAEKVTKVETPNVEAVSLRNSFKSTIVLNIRRKRWQAMTELSMSKEDERVHRLPDVMGIGIQKCGTGALLTFMRHHPFIQTLHGEAKFFNSNWREKGLDYYKEMLPPGADHEIVMEKSPAYFYAQPPNLPTQIHKIMPKLKVIVILCNPVQRALSGFAMGQEKQKDAPEIFDNLVAKLVPEASDTAAKTFLGKADNYIRPPVLKGGRTFNEGLYYFGIRRWKKEFGDSLLVINGEDLLTNPGGVMEEVQRFLDLPVILEKDDFVKNPESGMFCIRPWWDEYYDFAAEKNNAPGWEENLRCLPSRKGRSRSKVPLYTMSNKSEEMLSNFYRPYNERLYQYIGRNFGW